MRHWHSLSVIVVSDGENLSDSYGIIWTL